MNAGFRYLLSEKGIWNVYLYSVVMMFANGIRVLIYPYFEQSTHLDVLNYSLLLSFQSAGYMFGGIMHYFVKISTRYRYAISVAVFITLAMSAKMIRMLYFIIRNREEIRRLYNRVV